MLDFSARKMSEFKILKKKPIGEGTFGTVTLALDLVSNQRVALKRIRAKQFDDGVPKDVLREIQSLKILNETQLDNPTQGRVIHLNDVFLDKDSVVLVFEYLK